MLTGYYQSVVSFLQNRPGLNIEQNYSCSIPTPFYAIHFPEKKIVFHLIEINKEKLLQLSPEHFSLMSDAAEKQHIKLIHLWEDVWINQYEAVSLRMLTHLGLGKKIYGRLTDVFRPEKDEADEFLNKYHLQKSTNSHFRYGLVYKNELIAVTTFSKSRLMTYEKVHYRSYELIRFATTAGMTVVGGLSKLIAAFIKDKEAVHLMTYADRDWSTGSGYHKLGFIKTENTPPQLFWINAANMQRYYEHRLPEKLMEEFRNQHKESLEDFLSSNGYFKIYNSGNTKYILDLRKKPV